MFKSKDRLITNSIQRMSTGNTRKKRLSSDKLRFDGKSTLKEFKQEDVVIVVEGYILASILGNRELEDRFFKMTLRAKSVVCCRVSPKQKADVVRLYK